MDLQHCDDIAIKKHLAELPEIKPCPWEKPAEPHHVDVTSYENYPRMVSCTEPSCPLYARFMSLEKWNNR
jgi:hypothetical protein